MEAKALVDRKTDTLLDVRVRIMPTYWAMWREIKLEAYARLDALAHTVAEIEPKKFGDTLADLEDISYTLLKAMNYV